MKATDPEERKVSAFLKSQLLEHGRAHEIEVAFAAFVTFSNSCHALEMKSIRIRVRASEPSICEASEQAVVSDKLDQLD